jgi:hypothetical protein
VSKLLSQQAAAETTKSLVDKTAVSLENEKVQVPKPKTGNAISGLEIEKEGSPLRVKVQLPDGKDVMLEFDRVQLANKLDNFSQTELKFYKFHEVPAGDKFPGIHSPKAMGEMAFLLGLTNATPVGYFSRIYQSSRAKRSPFHKTH